MIKKNWTIDDRKGDAFIVEEMAVGFLNAHWNLLDLLIASQDEPVSLLLQLSKTLKATTQGTKIPLLPYGKQRPQEAET